MFQGIESEFLTRLNELTYIWHAGVGAPTGWEESNERVNHHLSEAMKCWNGVGKLLLPWYKEFWKKDGRTLDELWKAFKEEEKDPAYAAFLREERQKLRSTAKEAQTIGTQLEQIKLELQRIRKESADRAKKRKARSGGG